MMNSNHSSFLTRTGFLVALTIIAAGTVGVLLHGMTAGDDRFISPAYAVTAALAREAAIDGAQVGEVLMGDKVLLRIRTAAGGLSAAQRGQVVAERLNELTGEATKPESITTGKVNGQDVVLVDGQMLVTADPAHARINGTTPAVLAQRWAENLRTAFIPDEKAGTAEVTASVPTSEKVVPIISAGKGIRIGGAQVTGPRDRVHEVVAVAQLEGDYQGAVRARVLVPVSSENVVEKINRVPQTSVNALVDIKL
ncbi:MAG: hypothetical protein KBC96_11860 [Armatimonadetes bacterium]|nr:hypothetical protein [Armatimonadota bacterium]